MSGTIDTINSSLSTKANASDVQSSLSTKASVNADNFTSTGKQTVVGWGMPDYTSTVSISMAQYNSSSAYWVAPYDCQCVFSSRDYANNDIQYSSFVNNTCDIQFIHLVHSGARMNCYMCNILRNYADSIFYAWDTLTIKNSCIMENEYSQLVYQSSNSFYTYLYNCTCQNATSNQQSYMRIYSIPSSSFLHALDCLQTGLCVAQYDYLDDLDPYIPDDENELSVDSLSNIKLRKKRSLIFP